MKVQNFVPQSTMEIYSFLHYNFKFQGPAGQFDVDGLIDFQVELALSQLDNALQSDIFEPNKKWVNHLLREAYIVRKEIPDFMTRLVENEGKLSNIFYAIFHRIGSPFFTNKKGTGGFIPPRTLDAAGIQLYQLLVFREIINVFSGRRYCGMYAFCQLHSDHDITNALCLSEPWKRGTADDLCPFGQFWKTWGLNGEIPVS